MTKVVITVVGKDRVGIIANVCQYLSDNMVNIIDLSQTIVDGYFNMMMITDFDECTKEFSKCQDELTEIGEEMGVQIKCQKEQLFDVMHRL